MPGATPFTVTDRLNVADCPAGIAGVLTSPSETSFGLVDSDRRIDPEPRYARDCIGIANICDRERNCNGTTEYE